jgi:formylglycine-generating enzyme required for sulfatase activity
VTWSHEERYRNDRVLRGGSWNNNDNNLRVSNRNNNDPTNTNNNVGFRCVSMLLNQWIPACDAIAKAQTQE